MFSSSEAEQILKQQQIQCTVEQSYFLLDKECVIHVS